MYPFPFTILRIIIAENERVIARQISNLLLDWGHEIIYCGNDGWSVLEKVSFHPPDLILTGLYLKGEMDGMELSARLRARWDIPVILVSGAYSKDLPEDWTPEEGLFFLAKPFLPAQLRTIIRAALHQSSYP